jgi:hypothetical protein
MSETHFLVGSDAWTNDAGLESDDASNTAALGAIGTYPYLNTSTAEWLEFDQNFEAKWGVKPGFWDGFYYDATIAMAHSINTYKSIQAGCIVDAASHPMCPRIGVEPRGDLLAEVIRNVSLPSAVTGPLVLDENGDRLGRFGLFNCCCCQLASKSALLALYSCMMSMSCEH